MRSEVRTISVPLIPSLKPSRSLNMSRLWSTNYSSDVALVNCKTARLKYAQGEKLKYYESSLFVCSSRIGYYMFLFNEWMPSQSKTRLDVNLSLDITKKT